MHGGEPLWFCPSIKPLSQVLRLGGRERREQSREVKDRERSIADGVKKKRRRRQRLVCYASFTVRGGGASKAGGESRTAESACVRAARER